MLGMAREGGEVMVSAMMVKETVGELVTRHPGFARVFETFGIDYCCGGQKTLEEVCRAKGLEVEVLLTQLKQAASVVRGTETDVASMTLTALADHIEATHHAYLRSEMPRLQAMADKVASVHGHREPRLLRIRGVFPGFTDEITGHMMKEETVLFPLIREMEATRRPIDVSGPIRVMEDEHRLVASGLEQLKSLTDGFQPPDWACGTLRAFLTGLAELEKDFHQHIHKENNVLFPRALAFSSS